MEYSSKLLALGDFVFALESVAYSEFKQAIEWRYGSGSRVGSRARLQYLGPGEDKITLSGTLYPEVTGGEESLEILRGMADAGEDYPLIEGSGRIFGFYAINSLSADRSCFFPDGPARKIVFSMTLTRTDDDEVDTSPVKRSDYA